jgi:acyl transferase domain-containing protein
MVFDRRHWSDTDIAIVGMAGRFPGARTTEAFWANVAAGVESIVPVTVEALRAAGVAAEQLANPAYVPVAAVLPDMERFDAAFFGVSDQDAAVLDPQHRHFLECAWEAIEDAGYVPDRLAGRVGVYAGCGMTGYLMFNLMSHPALAEAIGVTRPRHRGSDKDALCARVSSLFGFAGPSVGIQTACSTSLVAVHVACQQLLARDCDVALAGGVTIELPHGVGYVFEDGEILSPDGHCRAFDADARGTVFGSGVGVVVLRRLTDADGDGDHVYAVIKGSAVNNDGSAKVGYLAPSVDGQAAAVREALGVSGVEVERIGYLEAHGTGTPVGDPIEVAALTQAFRASTARTGFCTLGSVKTNIGHLDTAAGVAGLIKAVKALEHRQLPPTLHFIRPNPALDLAASPFTVTTSVLPWPPPADGPRAAAVNSLGVGGTNAHVILQEAPPRPPGESRRSPQLLVLSARTPEALDVASRNLAAYLEARPHLALDDVAWTLQIGRRPFGHRRAVCAATLDDAVTALRLSAGGSTMTGVATPSAPGVALVCAGEGLQYVGMGRALYEHERVYRDAVTRCVEALGRSAGSRVLQFIAATSPAAPAAGPDATTPRLALFATEYALIRLYESWGLIAATCVGVGVGELVAAHETGGLSLADALTATRSQAADAGLEAPARQPANVAEALRTAGETATLFLAVGPADTAVFQRHLGATAVVVASMPLAPAPVADRGSALGALGTLWSAGAHVEWGAGGAAGRRVPLPTYPFSRTRHWIAPAGATAARDGEGAPVIA